MTNYLITPPEQPGAAVEGTDAVFPVRRIYCVGRNYAAHAEEMGANADRDPPFFFTKPRDAIVPNGSMVPYPPRTENLHHEIELVVAIGGRGRDIGKNRALEIVFGYAVGNDLTRRDLQLAAREQGRPWDTGKAFDSSAVISTLRPAAKGHIDSGRIWLSVNGETRQEADIADLIWKVPEIIAELSTLFILEPGDLIYSGTPAGVGPLRRGDRIEGGVEGLETLVHTID